MPFFLLFTLYLKQVRSLLSFTYSLFLPHGFFFLPSPNLGVLIKYSTVWVEETFAFFISIAFAHDAIYPLVEALIDFYYDCDDAKDCLEDCCERDVGLLWILLELITAMTGVYLYLVRDSIMFTPLIRELISDYSLAMSVLIASFFGSFVFQNTDLGLCFFFLSFFFLLSFFFINFICLFRGFP